MEKKIKIKLNVRDANKIYGRCDGDDDRIEIIYGIVGRLLHRLLLRLLLLLLRIQYMEL